MDYSSNVIKKEAYSKAIIEGIQNRYFKMEFLQLVEIYKEMSHCNKLQNYLKGLLSLSIYHHSIHRINDYALIEYCPMAFNEITDFFIRLLSNLQELNVLYEKGILFSDSFEVALKAMNNKSVFVFAYRNERKYITINARILKL